MGLFSRTIKPADDYTWNHQKGKYHGSAPKRDAAKAFGNLRRMKEKPLKNGGRPQTKSSWW